MVALAVVAISFTVLLSLRNRDISLSGYARRMTEATLLAREKMTEAEMAGFPEMGESSGEFSAAPTSATYRWVQTVVPTPFDFIREVKVAVLWEERERVELTTYLFRSR